jgi:hypothetical protein
VHDSVLLVRGPNSRSYFFGQVGKWCLYLRKVRDKVSKSVAKILWSSSLCDSRIDLTAGFNQFMVAKQDREKTTFT